MMKKVVLSGACGFIGQSLVKELLQRNCQVVALVVNPQQLDKLSVQEKNLTVIQAMFEDYENLPALINDKEFDVFIHMAWAGYGKSTNDYKVQLENVKYTCTAAYAAAKLQCKKFLLADSSHEYLKSINEKGEKEFCSIYGAAKQSAQRMCRVICHTTGMDFNGVIFTNIFGPGDVAARSTNTMIRKLLAGNDLDLIDGTRLYDWTYVDDCVGGVLAVAEAGKPQQLYYVGSKRLRPFAEIMKEVRDVVAPAAKLNFGRYQDPTFIDYADINTYHLYEDTKYMPCADFKEGVRKTVEWISLIDGNQSE